MGLIVQKYGGTSVADVERIRNVARRVSAGRQGGDDLVVVVSAMAGETNRLLALARDIAAEPDRARVDVLVSTGEQVTTALLAMALEHGGCPAVSLLGHQIRIATDSAFGKARIQSIDGRAHPRRARRRPCRRGRGLSGRRRGRQHHHPRPRRLRYHRRGARRRAQRRRLRDLHRRRRRLHHRSRASARSARKLDRISYDEMLELASLGAKVLQIRSVEFAKRYGVPVHVRSSFTDTPGHLGGRGGDQHGERPGVRRHVRPRRGQDHARAACPTSRASRRASSARSPTPTSSST